MAAPRATSFKALRNLTKVSRSTPAKRNLHVTGAYAAPAPIDPAHRSTYNSWSLQDLRGELSKRSLTASGTKPELVDRLAGHDSLQARAYSMAVRRMARDQAKKPVSMPNESAGRRHFNTSRTLKAVGDTSTIDFAYLPKLFEPSWGPAPAAIRVPILPHVESTVAEAILEKFPELESAAGGYQDTTGHDTLMKPQISSAAHPLGLSAMSDVHDGHHATEMTVETLTALTETVTKSAAQLAEEIKGKESTLRKVWSGLLDDIMGPKKGSTA